MPSLQAVSGSKNQLDTVSDPLLFHSSPAFSGFVWLYHFAPVFFRGLISSWMNMGLAMGPLYSTESVPWAETQELLDLKVPMTCLARLRTLSLAILTSDAIALANNVKGTFAFACGTTSHFSASIAGDAGRIVPVHQHE